VDLSTGRNEGVSLRAYKPEQTAHPLGPQASLDAGSPA